MRGTYPFHPRPSQSLRLIPAHAGNTSLLRLACLPCRVHPRSRREHDKKSQVVLSQEGSSPLARGKLNVDRLCMRSDGLIPTRAGNMTRPPVRPARPEAHPRSRGEHAGDGEAMTQQVGSSPLARGILDNLHTTCGQPRLIPARAGNMPDSPPQHQETQAHPRSRGEHHL